MFKDVSAEDIAVTEFTLQECYTSATNTSSQRFIFGNIFLHKANNFHVFVHIPG